MQTRPALRRCVRSPPKSINAAGQEISVLDFVFHTRFVGRQSDNFVIGPPGMMPRSGTSVFCDDLRIDPFESLTRARVKAVSRNSSGIICTSTDVSHGNSWSCCEHVSVGLAVSVLEISRENIHHGGTENSETLRVEHRHRQIKPFSWHFMTRRLP